MKYHNKDCDTPYKQKLGLCLINFSSNSTQTSCGHNLFKPRIKDPLYIRIEKTNEGIRKNEKYYNASRYLTLHRDISLMESFVVDVGYLSTEETIHLMSDIKDFHDVYDFFVITVIDSPKVLRDSIRTIKKLIEMNVPKNKIKVIFSKVKHTDIPTEEFNYFLLELKKFNIKYNIHAKIKYSEAYDHMYILGIDFMELEKYNLEDNKHRLDLLKNKSRKYFLTKDENKEIEYLAYIILLQKVYLNLKPVLDKVFNLILPMPDGNK